MIIVTGGAGFIGSALIHALNEGGEEEILVVDRLGSGDKWKNLRPLAFRDIIDREAFLPLLEKNAFGPVRAVLHMGACSSTTEPDADFLLRNNYGYSRELATCCATRGIRLVYASSAATYGDGSAGYSDDPALIPRLRPLNKYGWSKQLFDRFMLRAGMPGGAVGLKFFNVFGPNEYHKGEMRSVLHKFFPAARAGRTIRLFRSHRTGIAHGEQARDFVWIKDITALVLWFLEHPELTGIWNAGSGRAATFNELLGHLCRACGRKPKIRYVPMPTGLRDAYQYHTAADLTRLRAAGYTRPATPLGEAVSEYVQRYLLTADPYLGGRPGGS